MGKAKITFYGALAGVTSEKTTTVEVSTIGEAITLLSTRYGEQFQNRIYDERGNLRRFINIYINGKDIRFLKHLKAELKDGDEVSIIPAVGGG